MKRTISLLILVVAAAFLVGCGASGGTSVAANKSPFGLNLGVSSDTQVASRHDGERLDVIVPVFDPGIPEDPDEYEKLGIWPELRRTEAIRFAELLKQELQETQVFGDVRVAPDTAVTGDLYVIGTIRKSNGEDFEINLVARDVSGKRWMKQTYKHRVKEYHWQDIRQKGKDPYQPVFQKAASDLVKRLKKRSPKELSELRAITELRFAAAFVEDAFSEHLTYENKKIALVSLPADEDPMLVRTRAIRVADGLFMDKMQTHYRDFVRNTSSSYVAWQEHSLSSAKAARKAKNKAALQGIAGALLLIGAAAAAADNDSYDPYVAAGATAAAVSGVVMLQNSFATNAEGRFHRDNLMELGQSLNFEVAPQVVEVEDTTVTLRGDVQAQFIQWQQFLLKLYQEEAVPITQL